MKAHIVVLGLAGVLATAAGAWADGAKAYKVRAEDYLIVNPRESAVGKHVLIERVVEPPVIADRVIEKTVYVDRIVEKPVTVEKVVERVVERVVEKPVYRERIIERRAPAPAPVRRRPAQ
jgi:hypothetical protein